MASTQRQLPGAVESRFVSPGHPLARTVLNPMPPLTSLRTELHFKASAKKNRWAKRCHRSLTHFVTLIQHILDCAKDFHFLVNAPRYKAVQRKVWGKGKQILVIVKLRAGSAALKANSDH